MDEKDFEVYNHHGNVVNVRRGFKGKHRQHCLCWECGEFFPDDRDLNCPIANLIYRICVLEKLVLPVWECPNFKFGG